MWALKASFDQRHGLGGISIEIQTCITMNGIIGVQDLESPAGQCTVRVRDVCRDLSGSFDVLAPAVCGLMRLIR